MEILKLVVAFLKIGTIAFGGGWSVVGVIRAEVVGAGWLTAAEFPDVVAIAQVTPGPIALNAATLVGFRLAGLGGAMAATLAVVTPPMLLIVLSALLARKFAFDGKALTAALSVPTTSMLAMTLITLGSTLPFAPLPIAVSLAVFGLSIMTKTSPLAMILGAGFLNVIIEAIPRFLD